MGIPGSDGEAEIGVGGVEVGELVDAVVGEEDGADELVGHQTAEYLDPHGRPPQRSIDDANRNRRRGGGDASLGGENAEAVQTSEFRGRWGIYTYHSALHLKGMGFPLVLFFPIFCLQISKQTIWCRKHQLVPIFPLFFEVL